MYEIDSRDIAHLVNVIVAVPVLPFRCGRKDDLHSLANVERFSE